MTHRHLITDRRWRVAASALTIAALSACGGGGDAPAPAPAAAAAPAPAPVPTFFASGVASADALTQQAVVFDLDAATPVQALLPDIGTLSFWPSQARSVDAVAGTTTLLGHGQETYVRGGKVYTVNMRKGQVPAEVQVSALSTACWLADQFEVAADGSDTWFRVEEPGPDGDCTTPGDNRMAMVRTTGTASTAPVFLPPGVLLLQRLPDQDDELRWLLAVDTLATPPKLVLYDKTMTRADDVVNGAGIASATTLVGYNSPAGMAYLRTDGVLRRLIWNANGATVSPSLYTFGDPTARTLGVADATAVYFADGGTILRMEGIAPPTVLVSAPAPDARVQYIAQTPTQIVFQQGDASFGATALQSVAKSGGAVRTLAAASVSRSLAPWPVTGEKVAYFAITGSNSIGDWHVAAADGSADVVVAGHVQNSGVVTDPKQGWTEYFLGPKSLIYCAPLPAATDCNGGSLVQQDIETGRRTTLGTLPALAGSTNVRASASVIGSADGTVRVSGRVNGVTRQDVFGMRPGVANSLVRLTTNLP